MFRRPKDDGTKATSKRARSELLYAKLGFHSRIHKLVVEREKKEKKVDLRLQTQSVRTVLPKSSMQAPRRPESGLRAFRNARPSASARCTLLQSRARGLLREREREAQ